MQVEHPFTIVEMLEDGDMKDNLIFDNRATHFFRKIWLSKQDYIFLF